MASITPMLIRSIPLFVVGSFNILVGLVVFLYNRKHIQNKAFFSLALFVGTWSIGIGAFYMANTALAALWWAKLYYASPVLLVYSLVLFSYSFPSEQRMSLRNVSLLSAPVALLLLLLLGHREFLTQAVQYFSWGKSITLNKVHYLVYSTLVITYFYIGLEMMRRKLRLLIGLYHKQAALFLVGSTISALLGVLYNLILPWFGNYKLIWVGPIATTIFVGTVAISIIKHKMFDIRAVVARAVGYSASLFALAVVYGLITFAIIAILFGTSFSFRLQVTLSVASAFSGLAFPYIRRFFDKQTNRLFYRDAYDSQEFLAAVNKMVIASVNVEVLLSNIQSAITTYLKPQFSLFDLEATAYVNRRRIGDKVAGYDPALASKLEGIMTESAQDMVAYDSLPAKDSETHSIMSSMDIRLALRLVARSGGVEQKYGLLLLGAKRSGLAYDQKDIETLRIITSELAIAVQNALQYEEIDSFNETLQDKIETATKKLRQANDKLRKLDETKDEFVSMASHQLRTPLTSVKGYLSMVLEGDGGALNDTQRQMLTQSYASAQRMVYLISDLLNLSRLNTGKFVIEAGPVDLRDVVAAEIDQLHETAKAREITLTYEPPKEFPTLMLDETKIHQVVMNFMDNAIYYTPAGGKIDILLRETATAIEFRVKDTGIGVSRDVQRHLFTKFYRADNARRMRPDGTGLGLFMAKKIVVAQGGAILFESEEGKGSVFGFRFQKAAMR